MILLALVALAGLQGGTRYSVVSQNGRQWLAGKDKVPFLSFGVCCVGTGTPFVEYDPSNPSYAAFKYYPDPHSWATDTIDRLQGWGFNTIGAWSDYANLSAVSTKDLYFTPILHMGSAAGAPWRDMWDPAIVKLMDQIASDQIGKMKTDSRVIGYFSDNEMGWWEAGLFDWAWKSTSSRQHLVKVFATHYKSNWSALIKDFVPYRAASFTDLQKDGRLYLRPGGNGMSAIQEYIGVLADRYYSLCKQIIHKHDPGALFLGDRYISNFYPEVARAAGHYVDVLSTNLNADWNDGSFARFYLPALEQITHKPILISEYYMAAKQNNSGNKNDSSGFPVVGNQQERADGFVNSTRYLLGHPYVVGAHWFQYYDEPKNGRGDGENYNMGLVDTDNAPYPPLTQATRTDWTQVHLDELPAQLDVTSGIPPVPSEFDSLHLWPSSSYVPPSGASLRGDLYVTWAPEALYVAFYWNEDRFAESYYKDGHIPSEDRARAEITVNGHKLIAVMGDGGTPISHGASFVLSTTGVRNEAILKIPAGSIGGNNLQTDEAISLQVKFQTRGRAYTTRWNQNLRLSNTIP